MEDCLFKTYQAGNKVLGSRFSVLSDRPGFHMESSRLRGDGKMELLLAALAIAMAWSYSCGTWSAKHIAPIKLKKHGRPEHSVFARGLMLLGDLLHGFAKNLRCVSLAAFGILQAALAAQKK
jgi:hypothetical protein